MDNTLRKIAQFQLVFNEGNETYYIVNRVTKEMSYNIDYQKVENLLIMDRFSFVNGCIQRAGNNLLKKIQ